MNRISLKNKLIAIVLSLSMLISLVPSFSLTFTAQTDDAACTCNTEDGIHSEECNLFVEQLPEKCEQCGVTDGHEENCATLCTCEPFNGVHFEGCKFYVEPAPVVCPTCQQETCTCTPATVCEQCGEVECTCATVVEPIVCEHCGVELTEGVVHPETCLTNCTCEPFDGVHFDGCKFYVEPAPVGCTECLQLEGHTEICSQYVPVVDVLAEPTTPQVGDIIWIKKGSGIYNNPHGHENNRYEIQNDYLVTILEIKDEHGVIWYRFDPKAVTELHNNSHNWVKAEDTSFEMPEEDEPIDENTDNSSGQDDSPAETRYAKIIGLFPILWKDPTNTGDQLGAQPSLLPEIVVILETYVFSETTILYKIDAAEGYTWPEEYKDYHYIDSTKVQEIIIEDKVCSICGKDNCNIEHIKCNICEKYDCTDDHVYCSICEKYDCGLVHTDDSGFNTIYVDYSGITSSGIVTKITAPEGSFPEGTVMTVEDTFVSSEQVQSVISDNIVGIVSIDISFCGNQPLNKVAVYWDIPYDKIPQNSNKVIIVHMGSNGPEIVGEKYLNTTDLGETVAFTTDSFSSYAAVFVDGKYNSQKMMDILSGNSRYSVYDGINIDLFDYDPVALNNSLNDATSDGNGFHLTGYGVAGCSSNSGINNSEAGFAKQGIVASILDATTKLPIINYLNGTNAGKTTGEILFSDTYTVNGKTIYKDIPFEVIYDNQTGFYQYKSAVNHAQLNESGNKIELYADTLSTNNKYVHTIDLSTATGLNDINSTTATTDSFKGTVSDSPKNDRLDPYVCFEVPGNVDASSVGQIYVKAKVPISVGANQFQLFFKTTTATSWSEDKSFGNPTHSQLIPYTANGDWIEFIIDTSENSNWIGTISSIRVDLFDSNKGTLDVNSSYNIEIEQIRFIQKDYDEYATRGGFYPFSEIQDSYPGNNTAFNIENWETAFLDDTNPYQRASRAIYNPSPNPTTDLYNELAYGVAMEFDFYLPVNRTGEDFIYYFNGDDDLWVFVDGKLALDIGGGHGAITGTLNFNTGEMTVENAVRVTGYNSGVDTGTKGAVSGTMDASMYSAGKHTMKIFYLERGGSVSNCFMKFNLPTTPQGSVVVSKEVVENNNANNDVLLNSEFEFTISIQNNGTGDYQEITPLAYREYFVVSSNGESFSGTTDESGHFKLKSGQNAYFDIDENFLVTVEEKERTIVDHKWVNTTVNGSDGRSATLLTVNEQEISFVFVNIYERLYGNLKIIKDGISSIDHNLEETQSSIFTIVGQTSIGELINIEVVICGNDFIVINDLPVGEYTISENTDWSWRYDPKINERTVTVEGGLTTETLFENDRKKIFWLSGDSYCRNWWGNLFSGNDE